MSEKPSEPKLKVFISYSRRDLQFADQLVAALELNKFRTTIDRIGIHGAENWQARLGQLILEADIVVFVLSPDSARSEVCSWEVEESTRRAKRIIPVLCRALEGQQPHDQLRDLNYIHFYADPSVPQSGWGTGLARLVAALSIDVNWLREHTRLGELAERWHAQKRPDDLLVRGSELGHFTAWRAARPADAPELTDVQRGFLSASEAAEALRQSSERQRLEAIRKAQADRELALAEREFAAKRLSRRTAMGLAGAGSLSVTAGGLAWWGNDKLRRWQDAERRFILEQEAKKVAQAQSVQRARERAAMRTDIRGQFTAFATAVGGIALGGDEGSLFTRSLIKNLRNAELSLQAAIQRTSEETEAEAQNRIGPTGKVAPHHQRPFVSSDLNGEIYLTNQPETRRRRALVAYLEKLPDWSFPAVKTDAKRWEIFLLECGFSVTAIANPTRKELEGALESLHFDRREKEGQVKGLFAPEERQGARNTLALCVYCGTGVTLAGRIYLATRDFLESGVKLSSLKNNQIASLSFDLAKGQDQFKRAAASTILFIDSDLYSLRGNDTHEAKQEC